MSELKLESREHNGCMLDHLKIFLNTETNTTNPVERLGNFLLTNSRRLWKGRSVKFCQVRATPLKMHAITNLEIQNGKVKPKNPKFYDYILVIFTIIPGIILKGISYCSSEIRQRHNELVKSKRPFNLNADGIKVAGRQSNVKDPENATGTITITLSDDPKNYENLIMEKLSLLSPRSTFQSCLS